MTSPRKRNHIKEVIEIKHSQNELMWLLIKKNEHLDERERESKENIKNKIVIGVESESEKQRFEPTSEWNSPTTDPSTIQIKHRTLHAFFLHREAKQLQIRSYKYNEPIDIQRCHIVHVAIVSVVSVNWERERERKENAGCQVRWV